MRQPQAEEEAARRNREDPRRDRFVFYALDESAGIATDAWDVAMRLRRDDERPSRGSKGPRRLTPPRESAAQAPAALADPPPAAAEPSRPPARAERSAADPLLRELRGEASPPAPPAPEPAREALEEPTTVYDGALDAVALEEPPLAAEPEAETVVPPRRRRRRFGLVRLWGLFVMLVGLAFIAAVLIVAIAFRDYTHLSTLVWVIGVAAGLFAVWVGFSLARRRS